MNVNDFHKGARVVLRHGLRGNYLDRDFPGWGEPDAYDHLIPLDTVGGMEGVVTSVNSHGSNPWTRYTILLDNGGRLIDGIADSDFDWKD